ncbi:MAG: GNAT family N-acetyltransferase, partial [Gemmatimonadaceae bacterium]
TSTLSITSMQLSRFYVSRKFQGTGVARQMLGIVLAHAELQDCPTLWLSVWKENARAIAFYSKWGFASIGEATFLMGEDLQNDFIMERDVQASPPASRTN